MLAEWLLVGTWPFWLVTVGIIAAIIAAVENEKGLWATVCFVGYLAALHLVGGVDVLLWARSHIEWIAMGAVGYLAIGAAWGVAKWMFFTRKRAGEIEENYRVARKNFLLNGIVHPDDVKKVLESNRTQNDYHRNLNFTYHQVGDFLLFRQSEPELNGIRRINVANATEDTSVPPEMRAAWQAVTTSGSYHLGGQTLSIKPPRPNDHKSTIMTWMTFWPASMTWTMLNDPVRAAFRFIYAWLSRTLQDLSNRAFADLTKMAAEDTAVPQDPPPPSATDVAGDKGPLPPGTSNVPEGVLRG